ncbi:MAG: YceI family protein [Kordiimonas sp.]
MNQVKSLAILLSFSLVLIGCTAAAKILYPVNDDPLKTRAGIYKLDPTHANIIFSVNHLGFSLHHGRFNKIEGSLDLDNSIPEKSEVFIRVETHSIDTNSQELDSLLRAKQMFNAAEHPYISFESKSVQLTDPKTAIISGDLTLAGVRKPIDIEATFIGSGTNPLTGVRTIGFSGKGTLLRSAYGLTEWLPFVGDEVSLVIEAEFVRPT